MSLKNIIYIDYEKVYSLSSQLFEGVIQSAVELQETTLSNTDAVEIKAEKKSSATSDTNKLSTIINPHDYHYLKFEKELYSRNLIMDIDDSSIPSPIRNDIFVKIKNPIQFNDYEKLKSTSRNFTKIGHAINYVHRNEDIDNIAQNLKQLKPKSADYAFWKSQETELRKSFEDIESPQKKKFFDELSFVLDYAYGDEIEISQELHGLKFTSFLIRGFLKISPEMLAKLYSRRTTSSFSIVGIITRSPTTLKSSAAGERTIDGIRSAAWNMNDALFDLESTFCAPDFNEYFIEPIALYNEL